MPKNILKIPAMEIRQGARRRVYSFAVDGKHVSRFAAVCRAHRGDQAVLEGYQRPEVARHIQEIRRYLESSSPMLPNAIVIAFDKRVRFKRAKVRSLDGPHSTMGHLEIPISSNGDLPVGFVVDGQQRLAAIRDATVPRFPVSAVGFITKDSKEQAEQFILVNAQKSLPKGLIHELLPYTDALLPTHLHQRRLAARLVERLNHEEGSPFRGLIRTPTSPRGFIKDNSVLRMLGSSLTDGALYRYRDHTADTGDLDGMMGCLTAFWGAAEQVFSEAWGKPPRHSRLMHGAGIMSLGNLMDHIVALYPRKTVPAGKYFIGRLAAIEPYCAWTSGIWEISEDDYRHWNEIQNTRQDIEFLTNYLQRIYEDIF